MDARNSVYELLAYDYGWSRGAIADLFGRDLNSVKLPRRAPVVIPGLQVEVVEKDQAHGLNGTHGPPLMLPEATQ